MASVEWLLYANIIVWILLCSYIFFIGYKQIKLQRRLNKIEELYNE